MLVVWRKALIITTRRRWRQIEDPVGDPCPTGAKLLYLRNNNGESRVSRTVTLAKGTLGRPTGTCSGHTVDGKKQVNITVILGLQAWCSTDRGDKYCSEDKGGKARRLVP
jgi:hypothetical protein